MKYLIIVFLAFGICSCSFIRSVSNKRTNDTRISDSVATSKLSESSSSKKDSSTGESGTKSSKSNFQFVIDTSRKAPVVNNYITPASTGNQGFDFMRWLAANGYLKSGSINLQDDSTYQVVITPSNALTATPYYVTNKTTTSFDVVFTNPLTGTVAFDWVLKP